jgi:ABC-2 type transport system permease protein
MRVLLANIEEVFREAAARWTLIAYFVLSTMLIGIFASAVNLDVVDGALAGAKLFGQDLQMGGAQIDLDKLVLGFESGFSAFLFVLGTFLAIFATAHLVPRLQDKGTVDLYLSRPVGRVQILLARYVAGMMLAAANIFYLVGSIWLIVIWKTHIIHPRFLLGALVILFAIATLLAFAFLIGVVTSSTAVSIMGSYAIFFMSAILAMHDRIEAAMSSEFGAQLIHWLYLILPKISYLGKSVVVLVSGGQGPGVLGEPLQAAPFITTALFAIGSLTLASILFRRKEF